MRISPLFSSALLSSMMVPALLHADATIRYKVDFSSSVKIPVAMPSSTVLYMKGNKGATVSGQTKTIADFVKQEVTVVDSAGKIYATIPVSGFAAAMAGMMPKMPGDAAEIVKSIKPECESKKTGRTEAIQGVQAEERETNCSIPIPAPPNVPEEVRARMAGMGMKLAMRVWNAAPAEKTRVPALWQLSGFEQWTKVFMNPIDMMKDAMPGMASFMEDAVKDSSASLRVTMEISMVIPEAMKGLPLPDGPLMKMTQEVTELSIEPVDDAVFQIPDGFTAAPMSDVMKSLTRAMAGNAPSAQ